MFRKTLIVAALACTATAASAGEIYANFGLPGVGLGYAHALNDTFTVRGDYATLGKRTKQQEEEGINYDGTAKLSRAGLFGDVFVLGGLRLTGGVTFNTFSVDLVAKGNGGQIEIGGTQYTTTSADTFKVSIKYPKTTPYLGIGYGHQLSEGIGFVFDLGASIGKAKLTTEASGPNLGNVSQADIDAETAELRDGVAKIKVLPQLSIGLAVRF